MFATALVPPASARCSASASSAAPRSFGYEMIHPPSLSVEPRAPTTEQLFEQTHVSSGALAVAPLGSAAAGRAPGRSRRRRSSSLAPRGSSELHRGFGNDSVPPWLATKGTRAYQISTVETLPSFALLTTSTTVPTFAALYFQLSSLPKVAQFSSVFDQYRIDLIEISIEPQISEIITTANDVGEYVTAVDIDDANTPSAYLDVCNYANLVQTRGTQGHYHRFKPSVAVAVYSGAFTSFAATTSMWLDCGSPNIQHYGLKAASTAGGVSQVYTANVKMHVSWRARH